MSAKGQLSHIGIGKETVFGTPVPVTDYLKFNSESITEAKEELVSAQMPGRRDEPESYEGLNTISGETVHEVHPKGFTLKGRAVSNQSRRPGSGRLQ